MVYINRKHPSIRTITDTAALNMVIEEQPLFKIDE